MSERNIRKERTCLRCGESVFGKATALKSHYPACKAQHEMAAAEALMAKLAKDMGATMADDRVMNAEGD